MPNTSLDPSPKNIRLTVVPEGDQFKVVEIVGGTLLSSVGDLVPKSSLVAWGLSGVRVVVRVA